MAVSYLRLQGSAAFRQPPDCELEVDSIVFPVRASRLANTCLRLRLRSQLPPPSNPRHASNASSADPALHMPPLQVHSAIVCNASNLLDCLLASFLPTDEEEGQGAPEGEGDSAADQASCMAGDGVHTNGNVHLVRLSPSSTHPPNHPTTSLVPCRSRLRRCRAWC